jgi:ABC-type antimicrobial peptide transport system permease subunit
MIRDLDPDVAVIDNGTVADLLAVHTVPVRLAASVTAALGTLALLLAMLGLYGQVAYAVRTTTTELGIRMALGATSRHVQWLVMRQSTLVLLSGLAPGLVLAHLVLRALRSYLWGAETRDPVVFALVAVLLAVVSAAAAYLPSRRAARLDPNAALRHT